MQDDNEPYFCFECERGLMSGRRLEWDLSYVHHVDLDLYECTDCMAIRLKLKGKPELTQKFVDDKPKRDKARREAEDAPEEEEAGEDKETEFSQVYREWKQSVNFAVDTVAYVPEFYQFESIAEGVGKFPDVARRFGMSSRVGLLLAFGTGAFLLKLNHMVKDADKVWADFCATNIDYNFQHIKKLVRFANLALQFPVLLFVNDTFTNVMKFSAQFKELAKNPDIALFWKGADNPTVQQAIAPFRSRPTLVGISRKRPAPASSSTGTTPTRATRTPPHMSPFTTPEK